MRLVHTTIIGRPPQAVFGFLAVQENHTRFVRENVHSAQVSPGPMGLGSRLRNVARVFGREMVEHFEVVAFEPPRRLGKVSLPGSTIQTSDDFLLEPVGSEGQATSVTFTVTATPRTVFEALLIRAMTPVVSRSMTVSLGLLKELLEGPARREV